MSQKIIFKYGNESNIPSTKEPGQLLFAIKSDGTGNIYFDKDANTRIKMGLGTEGGTINGTLLIQNAGKNGHLKLYGSSDEGGNIQIQGPNNKYYWEMDARNNNQLRLYCHDIDNNLNYGFWTWNSDLSTLFPGKIQAPRAHFTSSNDALETANKDVALRLGAENGGHLDLDDNEIIAKKDATTMGTLYAQGLQITEGGNIIEGTWNGSPIAIDKGGTGATTAAGARAALEVPHFKDGIIDLNNLEGIGTSKDDGQWLKIWNLEHTASDGTKSYPTGLVPTKDGVQVLGTSAYKFKSIYALSFAGGAWNGNTITIDKGGTGATTAAGARTNLGVMSKTGDSATGNYTFSGKITLLNPSSSGNISLWADSEGGNLSIQSKSGTYSYQMDGNYDSFLRLISFKGSSHISDWYFYAESGLFESPKIQTGGLVVSAGHNYPGISLKKTSDNREIGYGGAIADDTTYAQIVYKGKDGYTEYYLMPAYTEGKGKDYWYDIYTSKNLRVGGRNLLKYLPLSKMPFGTGDSSGSDTKGTVSYDAGTNSLHFINNNSNTRIWLKSNMPVSPGETYTISCCFASAVQDEAGEQYQFQVSFKSETNGNSFGNIDKNAGTLKSFTSKDLTGNGWTWRVIYQTFTVPAGGNYASIAFRTGFDYQNYTNNFFVKNFKVEQSPVYTDWIPAVEDLLTVEGGSTYESLQIGTGKSRHLNLWAGDDGVTKIGHQDASWLETNAIYLYDSHTYFKKPLQIVSEQFWENSGGNDNKYGIDMQNSDIMNANGIYFKDDANSMGEGLNFARGTNTWDSLLASGGKLYFAPNRAKGSVGTRYEVYHSGGATIPISKGGTGATTAAGALANLGALSKSGSTIDSQAYFTWADAGHFNQSGVSYPYTYGGLRWSGESDGVQLYAEETASDNLDLILHFTDDSSNKLQIRNHSRDKTLEITANGRINAYTSSGYGYASMWADNEGGNFELKSNSGTYIYQMDAVDDDYTRLIAFKNGSHVQTWTFGAEDGKFSAPQISSGGALAVGGTLYANNTIQAKTTGTWAIDVNNPNGGEASIGYSQSNSQKWVLGVGCGRSGNAFALWNIAAGGLTFQVNADNSTHFYNNVGIGGTFNVASETNLYSNASVHGNLSVNGYVASGDNMYATYMIARRDNSTAEAACVARNNNGEVKLTVENSRGIWDATGGKWILSAAPGSTNWYANLYKAEASYEFYAHNSSRAGHFRGGVDSEGGYWEVKSKTGLYTYQFDALQDTEWRLYAWNNTTDKYDADITFDATKNRLVAHRLRLTSTADASETENTNVALTIGLEDSQHLIIDNNEILSKTDASTTGDLYLQGVQIQNSGNIVRGTWNGSTIAVGRGGTGATTASGARANLGALSNAGDTANGNYTINGSLTIQNTSTQKISLNNTNANGESSIGFNNAGTLKWVCGIGCGGSGNTFALWNNNLARNDITVDNGNGKVTLTGPLNIGGTSDITGITYSGSTPAGRAGHIWLKPI